MSLNKRKETMDSDKAPKRVKKECSYGEKCFRRNPAHFREYSHAHLEAILDAKIGDDYEIPPKYALERHMIKEQLDIIVEKQLYEPRTQTPATSSSTEVSQLDDKTKNTATNQEVRNKPTGSSQVLNIQNKEKNDKVEDCKLSVKNRDKNKSPTNLETSKKKDSEYRPVVPPTRRIESYFKVVAPRGKMAAKHAASAPYHVFYTTITDARNTHTQPYSITFQEILDSSLGELKHSLQINFMVEPGWLLAQYYFAGYSAKQLTIFYGEECSELQNITSKKPNVSAHKVSMPSPFGTHHTKMMILCYEDESLRVVISTANLYIDDWENRTQGLWFSPRCPPLEAEAPPHAGESPTMFKRSLLRYLNHYHSPHLVRYVHAVQRCDFSHINVFLVASVPGSHFDTEWGLKRAGALLREHCAVPAAETRSWPLLAQASSLGSFGNDPKIWLTGDFLHYFTKIKNQPQMLTAPPEFKLIYPSLDNVRGSHDGLLGGGCLPYSGLVHCKQNWLNAYMYQWKASSTGRDRAMPHIKSYTRVSPDHTRAAYYLLTSANVSKAAWGSINKTNAALRVMSYEAGVLLLPKFLINEDSFPLSGANRLVLPYDVPPVKYTADMSPWVSDYLR